MSGSLTKRPKHINSTTDQALRQRLTAVRAGAGWENVPAPTADDIEYARALTADPCAYCGERAGCIDHVDHDTHGWENLTASCRRCNIAKGQLPLMSFMLAKRLRADREAISEQIRLIGDPHGTARFDGLRERRGELRRREAAAAISGILPEAA